MAVGDETVHDFVTNSDAMTMYREWIRDSRTQRILSLVRKMFAPTGLPTAKIGGEFALYYSGGVDKYFQMMQLLTDLEGFHAEAMSLAALSKLSPMYGADEEEPAEPLDRKDGTLA